MEIHLKAQLTEDDFAAALRLHSGYRVHVLLGALFLPVFILVAWLFGNPHAVFTWTAPFVTLILWLIIFSYTWPRSINKGAAKVFAKRNELQMAYDITITDDALTLASPGRGERITPWSEYVKWKGNGTVVLAYPTKSDYRIFPRRWFASDADFKAFCDVLTHTIGRANK